jgi:hypothetical protein
MATASQLGLKPGDIGFTRIGGRLGWWIALGQALTGDANRFTHVFVVLDNDEVAEAMPSGARIQPFEREYKSEVAYIKVGLTPEQRTALVEHLRGRMALPGGIKYSFADYLALALAHFGVKAKKLRDYIAKSSRQICSQLADYELCNVGYHVFNDGRLPQDVTPGALFFELLELTGNDIVMIDPSRTTGDTFSPEVSE